MKRKSNRRGFTLPELLIVVAIIAVLLAIAIPIFAKGIEMARQATDKANARSAYALARAEWLASNSRFDSVYVFVPENEDGLGTEVPAGIKGYGKSRRDASEYSDQMPAPTSGVPYGSYVTVYISPEGYATIRWGTARAEYINGVAPYVGKDLKDLHAMSNDKRIEADRNTLTSLGNVILGMGWSLDDLRKNLSFVEGNGHYRIADYYQLKQDRNTSAGFQITSKQDGMLPDILSNLGYNGGAKINTDKERKADYTVATSNTVYNNSLFYSDELASNQFKNYATDKTKRSIIISDIVTDKTTGKITSFVIYTKAMDNEANLNDVEKAKFRVSITTPPNGG